MANRFGYNAGTTGSFFTNITQGQQEFKDMTLGQQGNFCFITKGQQKI